MTGESTYQAAQTVASTVSAIFAEHLDKAGDKGEKNLAHLPQVKEIETIIDVAFWASLRKEEGHSPRISLAFLCPEQAGDPIIFAQRIPLTPAMLTKLAPGFERPGIHLGVWCENEELYIWGATIKIPTFCFVLDVSEPGLVVIKHRRAEGFGKFSNIAVLTGDEIKIVDDRSSSLLECPAMITSLLDFTMPSVRNESVNVLLQLAVSIRDHKRGGTLLVVPSGSDAWRESIRHPLHYAIHPAFSGLAALMKKEKTQKDFADWQRALSREVDIIAGLTAIDGAIVINDQYELLAFGEKIRRAEGKALVEDMIATEPILGGEAVVVHPAQTGGTRHLSAAQFVHDQRDAIALVASQDGRFTVFTWSPHKQMVQAHRIDSLLL